MEIKELQSLTAELIDKIDSKMKFKHDADITFVHLLEEIGEIAREIVNKKGIKRKALEGTNKMEGEFADVIIMLMQLANNYDIDIEKAVKEKIKCLKERHGV